MVTNSLKWQRVIRKSRKRLVPKNTLPVRTRDKGVVVSYTAGVSLIVTLPDGVTQVSCHLVQCGGTPYVPAEDDVVYLDNIDGVFVVMGKYIL